MNLTAKKRVLYFCSSGVYGGAERFVEECMEQHKSDDIDARIFFLNSGRFLDKCLERNYSVSISPFKTRLKNIFSWIRFQWYFYSYLKKEKIDVVHFTMAYSQIFGALATRLAGVKIIWFQHGPIGGVIDQIANMLPYDHILFNSKFTRSEHIQKAGKIKSLEDIVWIQISTVFNPENVIAIRDEYKHFENILIATGRICRWKGYEVAIEAIEHMVKDSEFSGVLLIVGEPATKDDCIYFAELKKLALDGIASKQIKFLGFKDNIYDYIKASDLLIHCSRQPEPFGLVVAESMNLGTYVLIPPIGGVYEQLKLAPHAGEAYSDPQNLSKQVSQRLLKTKEYEVNINISLQNSVLSSDIEPTMNVLRKIYYS